MLDGSGDEFIGKQRMNCLACVEKRNRSVDFKGQLNNECNVVLSTLNKEIRSIPPFVR